MDTFDLAVIGGGTAGLVTSAGAASLGAKVALIERDRLGEECLYTEWFPSKALMRSAKVLHLLRRAADFGLNTPEISFDYYRDKLFSGPLKGLLRLLMRVGRA